ncbi:LacI family DNA-binding transcriptional regulator [Streptomyces sp. JV176]|uniref:LacI family DNA-binding transcriptional regulator n=1 Tax=Streptomyces sp. JV176 TaxID=858630 RepID=UPI002E77BEF7|nr:LacI family DNA-binding transcriptional regulator [Streptomyces sp. JV176]MEE1800695.1 LacI family DNA-binding transcriptional regulator [Streptomyces sp. JV176]
MKPPVLIAYSTGSPHHAHVDAPEVARATFWVEPNLGAGRRRCGRGERNQRGATLAQADGLASWRLECARKRWFGGTACGTTWCGGRGTATVSDTSTPRRPTATDVAREAGVSRATVGFVLNHTPGKTISRTTSERVRDAAVRLGYRPNSAARTLAGGRSRIVLLVLPDWPMEHTLRDYVEEAALVLEDAGYSLVTHTRRSGGRVRPLWEALHPDFVFGPDRFTPDEVASMRDCGIARIFPDPAQGEPADISLAVSAGPRLQVQHLYDRGCRNLAYATWDAVRPPFLAEARHRAAQAHAHSLGLPPLGLRNTDHRDGSADRAVREWRDTGVTGVVAFNDEVAAAVAGAAVRAGIRIPGELSVIGHDDTPLAGMFVPALSSIRFSTAALGRLFADLALYELDGHPLPRRRAADNATLVHREST